MKNNSQHETNRSYALKIRLANIRDELELYGWDALEIGRYMRDALKVLAVDKVVELFDEMLAEERTYYAIHTPLKDDQLDHTDLGV